MSGFRAIPATQAARTGRTTARAKKRKAIAPSTTRTICPGVVLATGAGLDGAAGAAVSTAGSTSPLPGWVVRSASIIRFLSRSDVPAANAGIQSLGASALEIASAVRKSFPMG
jgi:hypothetical protein